MDKNKATLAIYGVQDRGIHQYPRDVHDHSIVLMKNGKVVKMLELERLTRFKHDCNMHKNIYSLLKSEKLISSADYDVVFVDNVYGRSFISYDGNIRFEAPLNCELSSTIEKGRCWWFDKEIDGYILNHELAHVYSSVPFYGNFKENSLLVHFDGGASKSNVSVWKYVDGSISSVDYGWKLKYLSTLFNANALTFAIVGAKQRDQNSVPGKFMGFASFGKYRKDIEEWLIENSFFENIWGRTKLFLNKAEESFCYSKKNIDLKDKFIQDVAATIQFIFTRDFVSFLQEIQQTNKCDYLYYSGGSALSIVTNNKIVESGLFKDVFIPPCTSDTGLALGAAAFVELMKHGQVDNHSPYLNNWALESEHFEIENDVLEEISQKLLNGEVIGVCNGYGESGPRALGNRSIIALASSGKLAQKVSVDIKRREWYRPIAPIMLKKNSEYFTEKPIHHLSSYMLLDFEIPQHKRKEIEGVVHVNGTSRIQTIESENDNPFMYRLLSLLDEKYGVKALINTSFNIKGEPIVHTPDGAIQSAKNMGLNCVVVNGVIHNL